jgi:hypothetical protein
MRAEHSEQATSLRDRTGVPDRFKENDFSWPARPIGFEIDTHVNLMPPIGRLA